MVLGETGAYERNTVWGRIPGPALKVMAFIVAFAVAALIRIVLSKIF